MHVPAITRPLRPVSARPCPRALLTSPGGARVSHLLAHGPDDIYLGLLREELLHPRGELLVVLALAVTPQRVAGLIGLEEDIGPLGLRVLLQVEAQAARIGHVPPAELADGVLEGLLRPGHDDEL